MSGSMLASQGPDYSDDNSLVIPEQAPIRVFTDDVSALQTVRDAVKAVIG